MAVSRNRRKTLSALTRVIKLIERLGYESYEITTEDAEMRIATGSSVIDWEILEGIAKITDRPSVSWGVQLNSKQEIEIYLTVDGQ